MVASPSSAALSSQVDHLVVAASTLDEGVAWCEATLGITPGEGGEHPLMGTHNRLLRIDSPLFPQAYLEIIAIHSGAPCAIIASARRWFDLDNPDLQAKLRQTGPQLVHFVARTRLAAEAQHGLAQLGVDRGELIEASRMTPQGLLSWKITVRPDGQRLFAGGMPTLIEWGDIHPTQGMPASSIALQSITVSHAQAQALQAAYDAIGLKGVHAIAGPVNLIATLQTARGLVTLESKGI